MSVPNYSITTPENVDLHLELAGCGNRILAGLLDGLLVCFAIIAVSLVCLAAYYLVGTFLNDSTNVKALSFIVITVFLVFSTFTIAFGYSIFFEGTWRGQTPGKRFAGIRVVEQNGQPVSLSSVWIRNLLRIVDEFCFFVGLISMLVDKNERRIGDFAANTIVIRERLPGISTSQLKFTATLSEGEHFDTGLITPQEYELIVEFLKRRQNLNHSHRKALAEKLRDYFANNLHTNDLGNETDSEQFIEKLFLSYQARAEI